MKEKENKEFNSVTKEKQYANVENMTDSESLSWQYQERDREESIHDKTYRKIQNSRLGYLPNDYFKSDVERLHEMQKERQDLFSSTEQALDEISKQEEYTQELLEKISKGLTDTNNLCLSYAKCSRHFNNKLKEWLLDKDAIINTELIQLVKLLGDSISDLENFADLFNEQKNKFRLYIKQYKCKESNMRCDKEDYKQRNQDYQNTKKIEC